MFRRWWWTRKRVLLGSFFGFAVVVLVVAYAAGRCERAVPSWLRPFTVGFGGNLTSGIITGLLLLPLGIYIGLETEAAVKELRRITRERELVAAFEKFIRRESYHDIRLPDIDPKPLGLEFTVAPMRGKDGQPLIYEGEMETLYVVRVLGPAQERERTPEDLAKYARSPIVRGRCYFCAFYNGEWHLGESNINQPHRFWLSGKVGPLTHGMSADEFVAPRMG